MTNTRTQQPEALRLAGELKQFAYKLAQQSARELLRLHAESDLHLQELRSYRITVENREARIVELERELLQVRDVAYKHSWVMMEDDGIDAHGKSFESGLAMWRDIKDITDYLLVGVHDAAQAKQGGA